MKVKAGFFLLIVIILLSACGIQNQDEGNVTREQAIQTIRNISDSMGDVDIDSYPEMDKVVDNVKYYFIQAVFANKMSASYYVDEKEGKVFTAMGGNLDTENPLPVMESVSPEESEAGGVTEITASETAAIKEIFDTIGMTAEQVEQKFGKSYKKISVNYDGNMKGFLYSDKGFTVAFENNGTVKHVYCTDKIEINGAKSGMDFSQIQEILGEASVIQTWVETPINTAYKIEYSLNERTVVFFSRQKEGNDSIMCIS
jgi:hypothetical protein